MHTQFNNHFDSVELFLKSEQVIRKESSSFHFAFSQLPRETSLSIFVLYNFLRQLDDSADKFDVSKFNRLVDDWRSAIGRDRIVLNKNSNISEQVAYIFKKHSIDVTLMEDMIAGQLNDLNGQIIKSEVDLERYCYQVAGTVGCIIVSILDQDAYKSAKSDIIDTGIALQMTNILRDIYEDAMNGKAYIPIDLMQKYDVNIKDLRVPVPDDNVRELLLFLADKARKKYVSERKFINFLSDTVSRRSVHLSIVVYKKLLCKLIKGKFTNTSDRIFVTKLEKTWILIKSRLFLI